MPHYRKDKLQDSAIFEMLHLENGKQRRTPSEFYNFRKVNGKQSSSLRIVNSIQRSSEQGDHRYQTASRTRKAVLVMDKQLKPKRTDDCYGGFQTRIAEYLDCQQCRLSGQ
ncbi:hypothetical protein STEG23_029020 [Scotinomys teguina]